MRMKLETKILWTFILLCYLPSMAQEYTATELLEKVSEHYKHKDAYQVNMRYTMYKGLTGNHETESYSGFFIKKQELHQFELENNVVVTEGNRQIAINHDQKMIVYRNSNQEASGSPLAIQRFLEYYDESSIKNEKGIIICELIAKAAKMTLPYAKIIITIDADTYRIKEQEMYFSTQLPFVLESKDVVKDFGRLIITMEEEKDISNKMRSLKEYITRDTNGNLQLADTFKEYQLIDKIKQQ